MDEETEQLDESLINIKSDISELTNGKVSIMSDPDTYKSTYEILRDISYIWDDLTDKQQAGLLEKLFGKTRANLYPIIWKHMLRNYLIAGNALEPCTTIAAKARYEGLTTQGLADRAAKYPNVILEHRTDKTRVNVQRLFPIRGAA